MGAHQHYPAPVLPPPCLLLHPHTHLLPGTDIGSTLESLSMSSDCICEAHWVQDKSTRSRGAIKVIFPGFKHTAQRRFSDTMLGPVQLGRKYNIWIEERGGHHQI